MKKFGALLLISAAALMLSACSHQQPEVSNPEKNSERPQAVASPVPTHFSAHFQIVTNGTKRTFTQAMYHHQDEDAFIDAANPEQVEVTRYGITWNDFFKTLPFSLDEECLVTGTGQKFCNSGAGRLRFYVNEIETPNALDQIIEPGDDLKVTYGD